MRERWISLALALLVLLPEARARASDLRHSAWTAAQWALEAGNPQALSDSLALYLEEGGTLTAGDPFSALALLEGLRAMPGGAPLAEAIAATRARGQFGGAPRIDIVLAEGDTHSAELRLAAGEVTWIEARLWRDSVGADIDLEVRGAGGETLAEDRDPRTGTPGAAALVQIHADTCREVSLHVTNAGTGKGRVAILIPLSSRSTCEAPG